MSNKSKKRNSKISQNRFAKQRLEDQFAILYDNQDPFAANNSNATHRNNSSKKSKKSSKKRKKLTDHFRHKYSNQHNSQFNFVTPISPINFSINNNNTNSNNNRHNTNLSNPIKRRKMSGIHSNRSNRSNTSNTSNSSSDIEILNTRNNNNSYYNVNQYVARNERSPSKIKKKKKKKKKKHSAPKMSYNIFTDSMMPTNTKTNGFTHHKSNTNNNNNNNNNSMHNSSSAHSNSERYSLFESPLPFSRERIRANVNNSPGRLFNDTNDTMSVYTYNKSSKNSKSFDDEDMYSHRSKSRSTSPTNKSQSPSSISSKFIETQDKFALLQMNKNYKKSKPKAKNKNQNKNKNKNKSISKPAQSIIQRQVISEACKRRSKPKFGSLNALPISRNTGGRHRSIQRSSRRKHKQMYLKSRTTTLDALPQSSMSRDGQILTTEMNKENYINLMQVNNQNKNKNNHMELNKAMGEEAAEFILETESMGKNNKIEIDLTMDDDNDDELSNDIEILNDAEISDTVMEEDDDIQILSNNYGIKQARKQSYKKFDTIMSDAVYHTQRFAMDYDPLKQTTQQIMNIIERYQKEKEEERIRIELEQKQAAQSQALKALEEKEKMEIDSVSNMKQLKLQPLDDQDYALINQVFELPQNKIVGSHEKSNIEVTVKDLNTLEDGQWLNDEVMNFYMALLQDRNLKRIQDNKNTVRVLFMNTFFFTKLRSNGYNYKAVKRWTKKVKLVKKGIHNVNNIFELDKFIFPVHVNNIHWCCGCINFKRKKFEYYDSMNGSSAEFFRIIRLYLQDEWKDKLKSDRTKYDLDMKEWNNDNNRSQYPQQQNGVDCGVFTSKCADWISDDLYPDYSQDDMGYFRERMMIEIIRGKTLDF